MKKHLLFITEGVDDVAIISSIIEHLGVAKEKCYLREIDEFWRQKLIPQRYPFRKDKLDRVSPVPNFYEGEKLSIAIKAANGENNIFKELDSIFQIYTTNELEQIDGIFILCDADEMTPDIKLLFLLELAIKNGDIDCDVNFEEGFICTNSIKIPLTTFVYPNNSESGALENILLNIAGIKYPDLLKGATEYVARAKTNYEANIGVHEKKAVVGCVCNVLRPAAANNISIKKDKWVGDDTIGELRKLYDSIREFVEV